jgi:hypothetical protein
MSDLLCCQDAPCDGGSAVLTATRFGSGAGATLLEAAGVTLVLVAAGAADVLVLLPLLGMASEVLPLLA